MRGKNGIKFFAVIAVIAILTFLALNQSPILGTKIPSAYDIRPGIDISGGIRATLEANTTNTPTADNMESVRQVIEKRLDSNSIFDRTITPVKGTGRIVVEIPFKSGNNGQAAQSQLIDELGNMAQLTFQEVDESKKDANGLYLPTGKIIIKGTNVKSAKPERDTQTGEWVVALKLDSDGAKKFSEATGRLIGKPIAIFMDQNLISYPTVSVQISDGNAIITGQKDAEEAGKLAAQINSGSLPFNMKVIEINEITPQLGASALAVSIKSGIIAFILVVLFMLLYYRLPGIFASIALLGHTVIQLLFLSWLGITVTLPGIAGIILTIGMGVDANVIIFERIKEELRNGKTLRSAIDVGFKRAFSAILDANITTLIVSVVLYFFGTGPIKSFAITLGLGVALSFLTAVTASRIMLRSVSNVDFAKHKWLYGVGGAGK